MSEPTNPCAEVPLTGYRNAVNEALRTEMNRLTTSQRADETVTETKWAVLWEDGLLTRYATRSYAEVMLARTTTWSGVLLTQTITTTKSPWRQP
ncbi:MAG TPA: hypothetical protein VGN19_05710 [Pedococcus sp.]|jgi:hypothetical protein|nr:hypothetical protein [Pedococcus sp.]